MRLARFRQGNGSHHMDLELARFYEPRQRLQRDPLDASKSHPRERANSNRVPTRSSEANGRWLSIEKP
jgi:hypothetical protein